MSALNASAAVDDSAAEAKAALLMHLRGLGVRTVAVLRAMETVPRASFVDPRHAALAAQDIALPLAFGQTGAEPSFVARQLEALTCGRGDLVLEVGSGSGYVTTLLAHLAGAVRGVERYRGLAEGAQARLAAAALDHARVTWGDGLEDPGPEPLDRIVLHVAVPAPPATLIDRLAPGGIMVCPIATPDGRQDLMRLVREREGTITVTRICAARLQPAAAGRSRVL